MDLMIMRKSIVEEWRGIPKYCGLYQAGNSGYVRSVAGVTARSGAQRCIKGRTLSPAKDRFGYDRVTLSKKGVHHTYYIHRPVAGTFIPDPDDLPQMDHKDENPDNNEVSDLEWRVVQYDDTYGSGNLKASLADSIIQLDNSESKAVVQSDSDGNFISGRPSVSEMKRRPGSDVSNIADRCKGHQIIKGVKTTGIQAYGYKWRYE